MDKTDALHYNRSPILAIDFDGTIVKHRWPEIGPAIPGAIESLRTLTANGARLMLWTNRSGKFLEEAIAYLKKNSVELWGINENPEQGGWTDSPKQYAHIYVDDAGLGCPLMLPPGERPYVDWSKVGPLLLRRVVTWQPHLL